MCKTNLKVRHTNLKDKEIEVIVEQEDGQLFFDELNDDIPNELLKKPHARLAILFQAIESKIALHRICKRIFEEKVKTVPVFTVHDCFVTTQGNEDYLKKIIIEEFTTYIGYPPPLGVENWV